MTKHSIHYVNFLFSCRCISVVAVMIDFYFKGSWSSDGNGEIQKLNSLQMLNPILFYCLPSASENRGI